VGEWSFLREEKPKFFLLVYGNSGFLGRKWR